MNLSIRLESIISMVSPVETLADIGTDHAWLLIELLNRNIIQQGIAIDNKEGPLAIAQRNVASEGLTDKISLLKSDGALKLKTPAQAWVIAGIGGENTLEIIENSLSQAQQLEQLILAPHSKIEIVRARLAELNFTVRSEQLVKDEKFYVIINAQYSKNQQQLTLKETYLGNLESDPLYEEYVSNLLETYQQILTLQTRKDPLLKDVIEMLETELRERR
ncbi:MAG: SAM-dependent methyltransferase [Erysipelothrix sp.]|nr:SAM-dependent methyltransferase [Erysipelothrix sp.]